MNKPVFKTEGIMTAAAILTIVIFAQTKPPVSTFTRQPGWQDIQKSGEVFRGGVYGDMFSVRCVQN
jgi:hypothetical protein